MKVFPGHTPSGLDYHGECRRTPRALTAAPAGQDFFHFVELEAGRLAVSLGEVPADSTSARLFYARIDGIAGELSYVNARSECVLLVRFRPERVRLLDTTEYRERKLRLEPGDLLLAATHGVTDAVNGIGDRWSIAGLLQVVMENSEKNAANMVSEIMRSVNRFAAPAPPTDDRTVVVVRFQGNGEEAEFAEHTVEPVFAAA